MSRAIGAQKELKALQYLKAQGLKHITSNYSCKAGEIDLIMQDGSALVFVEVRFRKNSYYGGSGASVNKQKQRRLAKTALHYLQKKKLVDQTDCRFDVVAIDPESKPKIMWLKGAFDDPLLCMS